MGVLVTKITKFPRDLYFTIMLSYVAAFLMTFRKHVDAKYDELNNKIPFNNVFKQLFQARHDVQ